MRQKISQFIEKELKLASNTKLVLGVSGGVDSVVMTHILNDLGYHCIIAHCNFHLRGEESNRDENVVFNFGNELNLKVEKIDFDTKTYAKQNKLSIEMAARELRYRWFEEIRQKHQAQYVAVAHHSDDSVETLLMNLIRGTGLRGLKGIEAVNDKIIRPMLCCTRSEIEQYASNNQLKYIFDSSNAETDFVRNKIRLEVVPKLAEINPAIKQTLAETTERLLGTWKVFEQAIEKIKQEITYAKDNKLYIDIEKLQQQPDIQTVLFEILQPYQFHSDTIIQLTESLNSTSGLQFHSVEYVVIKDRKFLILSDRKSAENIEIQISEETTEIEKPLSLQIKTFEKQSTFSVSKLPHLIQLDLDKIKFPLTLRKWRTGDFFYPFGMNNSKKVSDFLIDEKVNILDKQDIWVLTSEEKIAWIVGMRTDNRFKINTDTQKILEIKLTF